MMRAFRVRAFDAPPTLDAAEKPVAVAGEVLVRMSHAALNPLDLRVASGHIGANGSLPRTLGVEGVGFVEGRPFVVHGAGVGVVRDGTLAEWIAAPESALIPVPENMSLELAAACGNVGGTAIRIAEFAESQAGQRALVLGASGAVGRAVCSLLRGAGVEVLAQVRSSADAEQLDGIASQCLLIADPAELADALGGRTVDMIVDSLSGGWTGRAVEHLSNGGRLVVFGVSAGPVSEINMLHFYRRGAVMRGYAGAMEPQPRLREAVSRALSAVLEGTLKIGIGARMPLTECDRAWGLLQSGPKGKVLVEIAV